MIDLRLRNRITEEELERKVGKVLGAGDVNLLATGPLHVRKPDNTTLFFYLPGAIPEAERDVAYPVLHGLRDLTTTNRGYASGGPAVNRSRARVEEGGSGRQYYKAVSSNILGAFDPQGGRWPYCRLTAWTGKETEKFKELWPMFRTIGEHMREVAPERWAAQQAYADATRDEWVIPGTPFTTITVNNTYPTGVHTDKGDLDEGISTIACLRRGEYSGGWLCFPRYRVGVDLRDGDLIVMDAHEWHGNTAVDCACEEKGPLDSWCAECGAERISIVSYFRTKVSQCGSFDEEEEKRVAAAERRATTPRS